MKSEKLDFDHYITISRYKKIFDILRKILVGKLIKKGKRIYAIKLYNDLQYFLKKKTKKDPNLLMLLGLYNSLRKVHFIKLRFGGVKKEVPVPLSYNRQITFAIKSWLDHVRTLKSINVKRLANLICYSLKYKGPVLRKKYQQYRKALDNRILITFIKR